MDANSVVGTSLKVTHARAAAIRRQTPVCAASQASAISGCYPDGTEELYDHVGNPNEWTNRADDPALASVKGGLAAQLAAMVD